METKQKKYLIKNFQGFCQQYFVDRFAENKFLYFDKLPLNYFGTDYQITIVKVNFDWLEIPNITFNNHLNEGQNTFQNRCQFEQSCKIEYFFNVNSLIESGRQSKILKFRANTYEPFGQRIEVGLEINDLRVVDDFDKKKQIMKSLFQIKNIDEIEHNNKPMLHLFTDITRKQRTTKGRNPKIVHMYVYWEIAACHNEIQECLLSGLFYQQYISDLLGEKRQFEGLEFYERNFKYVDFQYLMMIGFGFDRLYSFWERITFLLANYDSLKLDLNKVSFDGYFKVIEKNILNNENMLFNKQSKNLLWLVEFHKNKFNAFKQYRHRIVHYKITPNWEGILSAKFSNNALEYTNDKVKLTKLKLEFEGLGNMLYEHFNYCKEGLIKALCLIDELD